MVSNRKKLASEWFYNTLYRDELIRPLQSRQAEALPEEIRAMREMESGVDAWRQTREQIFVRQAIRMADYEDTYSYDRDVVRYFPTYQSLTDRELRGYFSWRTKWRRGERTRTNLSFAFLYIYELINQIGVKDPVDGFEKLRVFEREYGALDDGIYGYLKQWLWDYVIFYRLDPVLLADRPEITFDRYLLSLGEADVHSVEKLMEATLALSAYRLDRSLLYAKEPELAGEVVARILRKVSGYYSSRRKESMCDDYFGPVISVPAELFRSAVFVKPKRQGDFDYVIDPLRSYQCRAGSWTVRCPDAAPGRSKKLGELVRTIDAMLRERIGGLPEIQPGLSTKWIVKIIDEEIRVCLQKREEAAANKIEFDFSKLGEIRRNASETREKLIVEEDENETGEEPVAFGGNDSQTAQREGESDEDVRDGLTDGERRLLRCLLYGQSICWVREEGLLLSVLVDGINEKLYERFNDTVLLFDTEPELLEEYLDDLREMIAP